MTTEREAQLIEAIAQLPRVPLASVRPTPLEPLPRLSAHLGGPPLYIKRDDLTGLAMGGNKTRMFEFALADALHKGADTVVAGSAVQSNYCRQLSAACAKLDLELAPRITPVRPVDKIDQQGNNLLQRLLGAHVTVIQEYDRRTARGDPGQDRRAGWARRSTGRAKPIPLTSTLSPIPNRPWR